jgi:hypothetical protein
MPVVLGLALSPACGGLGSQETKSGETDSYVSVAPNRLLDMVFMVDNSPCGAADVTKMNAQFPKLIAELKDPSDGTLPDLRVAVIDSDLGTGGAYSAGSCATRTLSDGTTSYYGDMGRFQMLSSPTACTFNSGALFLEYKAGQAVNYTGDINTVFACLASNLGTTGCGYEHQLQAFEFALVAKGIGNETQQQAFLRGNAYLGLVFLTDEDDCSAATNDGLFGDKPELRGESASLRCATRAHMCGGKNLADSPPGYPTVASFTHAFSDCRARMGDECPSTTDTSVPTDCNPLKSIKHLADEIKALKPDPDNQILVAGIFGWPLSDADMATAQYKIAPIPNPNTADTSHPAVYDYWPVCYDPDHMPTQPDSTGFDASAAGWGAPGGLRNAAFVDQFGKNGLKFSICQSDFSASMKAIGAALANMMQNQCFDFKLVDTDLATAGVQADCRAVYSTPSIDPKDATKVIYNDALTALPQCPDGATDGNVSTDCWHLVNDTGKCQENGQSINVLRTAQEIAANPQLVPGMKLHMQCRICPDPTAGAPITAGCDY